MENAERKSLKKATVKHVENEHNKTVEKTDSRRKIGSHQLEDWRKKLTEKMH